MFCVPKVIPLIISRIVKLKIYPMFYISGYPIAGHQVGHKNDPLQVEVNIKPRPYALRGLMGHIVSPFDPLGFLLGLLGAYPQNEHLRSSKRMIYASNHFTVSVSPRWGYLLCLLVLLASALCLWLPCWPRVFSMWLEKAVALSCWLLWCWSLWRVLRASALRCLCVCVLCSTLCTIPCTLCAVVFRHDNCFECIVYSPLWDGSRVGWMGRCPCAFV